MSRASVDVLNAEDAAAWVRCMREGAFESAWEASDRIRLRLGSARDWTLPRHHQIVWDGSPLRDRHVLVRCYHGLGDTIQFLRYLPPLRAIASRVTLWVQPWLLPLLHGLPGVDALLPLHDGRPEVDADVDIEIMELPYAFRTTLATIPASVPYLRAEAAPPQGTEPAVGLVWRAGDWDPRRSIPFARIRGDLLGVKRIAWHALQLNRRTGEDHRRLHWPDTGGAVALARAIAGLTLLISVDSMPAHLAGALGVPVWTLVPADADWRWMERRADTPWYPTMTLFRQSPGGDWGTVLRTVAERLKTDLRHLSRIGAPLASAGRTGNHAVASQEEIRMPRTSTPAFASPRPTHEDIARRAYDIFVSSGSIHGNDVQHWLEAEQSLTMVGSATTEPSVVADAPARARPTRVVTGAPASEGATTSALGRAPARRRRKGEAAPPKSA